MRRLALLFGLAGALALPAAAHAATAAVEGGTLVYTAADGLRNNVSFDQTGAAAVRITRTTSAGDEDPITAGTGCVGGPDTVNCSGVSAVSGEGRDRDDTLDAGGLNGGGTGLTTIPATLTGSDGDDTIDGGAAADTLNGGNGNDNFLGNGGSDTLNGGPDDDFLSPGPGNDVARGDEGDDQFVNAFSAGSGTDADRFSGGNGYDTIAETADSGPPNFTPVAVTVTLDGTADDGAAGEGDDVPPDIEAVNNGFFGTNPGDDTLIGSAAQNSLDGGPGNDTVEGGTGNDVLNGGSGNDTLRARDGFADVVTCGPGGDSTQVDTLDQVAADCETVDRADVGNANDDRPPTVAFTAPADGAKLPASAPTTLSVDAADDRGIAQVQFLDDGRPVCTVTAAPYTCSYQPGGDDVGANTLIAIATDFGGQTATAVQVTQVDLFAGTLSLRATPARDRRAPYRFSLSGRLSLPRSVTAAQGCSEGDVSVGVKAGSRTISGRHATLRRDCSWSLSVAFKNRRRFGSARSLRFLARFEGNEVVKRAAAPTRTGRVR